MIKITDEALYALTVLGRNLEFNIVKQWLVTERIRLAIERRNDESDYVQGLIDLMDNAEKRHSERVQVRKETFLHETGGM